MAKNYTNWLQLPNISISATAGNLDYNTEVNPYTIYELNTICDQFGIVFRTAKKGSEGDYSRPRSKTVWYGFVNKLFKERKIPYWPSYNGVAVVYDQVSVDEQLARKLQAEFDKEAADEQHKQSQSGDKRKREDDEPEIIDSSSDEEEDEEIVEEEPKRRKLEPEIDLNAGPLAKTLICPQTQVNINVLPLDQIIVAHCGCSYSVKGYQVALDNLNDFIMRDKPADYEIFKQHKCRQCNQVFVLEDDQCFCESPSKKQAGDCECKFCLQYWDEDK